MSQEEYRNEGRRPAQSRSGHGGRRVAPSHPEGERRSAPCRRKKRLGGWGVLLYVIFVLGISALLAGVGWIWANDVLALNKPALTAVVEIDEGDTVGQVADKLEEQGLIEYKMVFKLFCSLTHTSGKAGEEGAKITPGTYELNTDMDYRALISSMGSSSANRMTTTVTIPEGMTEAQIFSLLEEKGYDPLAYRFFCLQSHYRKGLVFSWENLDNAKAAYDKLVARVAALSGEGTVDEGAVERFKNDFLEAVGNDLNTSLGVTALYDVLKAGVNDATKRATLDSFDQVLGLELLSHADALKAQQAAPVEGAEEIEALIAKRLEAKRAKNWAEADAIRDQLRAMGVEIKDGKDGTTWTRI